jgi:hypothetical protein
MLLMDLGNSSLTQFQKDEHLSYVIKGDGTPRKLATTTLKTFCQTELNK